MSHTKIISKDSFHIVGIETRTSNDFTTNKIPEMWDRFFSENISSKISNKVSDTIFAIYTNYEGDYTKAYTYILACEVHSLDTIPDGMIGLTIEKAKFELFTAKGKMPQKIVETWQQIWKKEIDSKRTYQTDFEIYGERYDHSENSEVDIYIGVR